MTDDELKRSQAQKAWDRWARERGRDDVFSQAELEAELPPGWRWVGNLAVPAPSWWETPADPTEAQRQAMHLKAGRHPSGFDNQPDTPETCSSCRLFSQGLCSRSDRPVPEQAPACTGFSKRSYNYAGTMSARAEWDD